MNVGRRRWILLAVMSAVAVGALVAISWIVLTYERHTHATQEFNELQRQLDLATWQVDAAIAPLLAGESARPDEHYRAFYQTDEALTQDGAATTGTEILVA